MLVICTIATFSKHFLRSEEAKQSLKSLEKYDHVSPQNILWYNYHGRERRLIKLCNTLCWCCKITVIKVNQKMQWNSAQHCLILLQSIDQFTFYPIKGHEVMTIHANNNTEIIKRWHDFNTNGKRVLYLPVACLLMEKTHHTRYPWLYNVSTSNLILETHPFVGFIFYTSFMTKSRICSRCVYYTYSFWLTQVFLNTWL